jgi:hypothetical protein
MTELLEASARMRTCRPTSRFPAAQEVEGWLREMGQVIDHLPAFTKLATEDRSAAAGRFAAAAIKLTDFLRDIDVDSDTFWEYFEATRSPL